MKIRPLIQPDDFDHLCEWWMIEREKKGNFTALRILEKQYPQYARELSEWVMGFLDFEDIVSEVETEELDPAERERLDEMARRVAKKMIEKLRKEEKGEKQ